jgi:hypothetical protein
MAYRYRHAKSACAEPGCPNMALYRNGRCREHQHPRGERADKRVIAALRAQLVARDGERCTICGATSGLEVHHLDGVTTHNTLDNVELRCASHNPRGGAREADAKQLVAKYQRELATRAELRERHRIGMGGYP